MVRKFSWGYRRQHIDEFPFICNICGPEDRRFRTENDQEKHDDMTKRHDPDFVHVPRKRKRRRRKTGINKVIDTKVLLDKYNRNEYNSVVKHVGNILKNNVSPKYRPAEVIKAGSTGKGTAIKGNSDVDIVFLLPESNFTTVESMLSEHKPIFDNLQKTFTRSGYNVTGRSPKSLQLKVKRNEHGSGKSHDINVDVLPAANLENEPLQEIYRKMKTGSVAERKFYTTSLTKRQTNFVKCKTPEQLKRLIRIVKFWKGTMSQATNPPSSYSLELLAIYLWQQDGKPESFRIENGLCRVMQQLADYQSIKVEFSEFYDYGYSKQQRHREPYIIDPVNQYSNVLDTNTDWKAVERNARKFLESADMKNATSRFCDY